MLLTHPPANMANNNSGSISDDENLRNFNFGLMGFNFPSPYSQQEAASSNCSVQAHQQSSKPRNMQHLEPAVGRSFYYAHSSSSINLQQQPSESSTESSSEDDADTRRPGTAITTTKSGPGWQYITHDGGNRLKGNLFRPLRPRFYLVPDVEAVPSNSQRRRRAFANKAKALGSEFIQMNAIIMGFGSPEKLAENAAPVWWDERRIRHTVTASFVTETMPKVADLRQRLKQPVGFGELTDETYLEWIVSKTRRFFLILEKLGIPEQIFGIVDDSWDDNDLPIPMEGVSKLRLASNPDKNLDKRFWEVQYKFLLRGVSKLAHIDYAPYETVPVEFIEKVGSHFSADATSNHTKLPGGLGGFGGIYTVDKVAPPNGRWTKTFYTRVTIPLKDDEERVTSPAPGASAAAPHPHAITKTEFTDFIGTLKNKPIDHPNIVQLFASYTSLAGPNSSSRVASILYAPYTASVTLESFLRMPSYLYNALAVSERRVTVFNWMTSLASAIAYLHARDVRHGGLRPKNILVVGEGKKLLLADAGLDACPPLPGTRIATTRVTNHNEMFEYGAPEDYPMNHTHPMYSCPSSNNSSASGGSNRSTRSFTMKPKVRRSSAASATASTTDLPSSSWRLQDDAATIGATICSRPATATGDADSTHTAQTVVTADSPYRYRSDIFSLACVMLEIINFASRKKSSHFRSHRRNFRPMLPTNMQLHSGTFLNSTVTVSTMNTVTTAQTPSTATDRSSGVPSSYHSSVYDGYSTGSWLSPASVASSPATSVFSSNVASTRMSTTTYASSRPTSPLPPSTSHTNHSVGYGAFRKKTSDGSFHGNLPAVHSWCDMLIMTEDQTQLEKDPKKEKERETIDRTRDIVVKDVIGVCREMLAERPESRPEAEQIVNRLTELAINLRDVMEEIKACREGHRS